MLAKIIDFPTRFEWVITFADADGETKEGVTFGYDWNGALANWMAEFAANTVQVFDLQKMAPIGDKNTRSCDLLQMG